MDIDKIIDQMTLREKCEMLTGKDNWRITPIERLGVPEIMMADGPHGLRKEVKDQKGIYVRTEQAVCYPSAVTVASSFDPEIASMMGDAIATECRARDVHLLLGPGINIKRNPLCGRNFEYYSEDPLVSGTMAKAFINALQNKHIGACIKHYALNSQETYRMISSSITDERAKHEIYYKAFHDALEANPDMVMCSYNRVDDVFASENKELLDDTLRRKFGFKRVIVSDWGAVKNRSKALKATLDLEMPGYSGSADLLEQEFQAGNITTEEIDSSIRRLLELIASKAKNKPIKLDLEANHKIAYQIAAESMILLKNKDAILPLKPEESLAIIGEMAKTPRYQGGGSSHINPYRVDSILEVLPKECDFAFASGYSLDGDGYDVDLIQEAVKLAKEKSKVILFIGLTDLYESEGYDRIHLDLPSGHVKLLEEIAKVNPNIVTVLQLGSPITMPWIDKTKGLVNAYLYGEAGAKAVIDVLFGFVNPSGRLAETFACSLEEIPSTRRFAKGNNQVYYQESIYVGYRYFTSAKKQVLFSFGYGLSYTDFAYSELSLNSNVLEIPGKIEVSVTVRNTGKYPGKEVVQLYVENPQNGIFRPLRELRAFKKIHLDPDESKTVIFVLTENDFAYYNTDIASFTSPSGEYRIEICQNAEDVILSVPI
ncbi:MAG: glycoside hydrolase family 3 C-terminal domain-containing protein, partial [Bacilli bacterium]|nr:glycoside hydrolase family 3 C-terminal domain-containing protein [Bacilli bacterium]